MSFNFNLNTQDVKKCLEEYDIKAIMLIHTYGNPADMEFYKNLYESNFNFVEDTCESMGASWDNKPVGSFGDLGTFSSYFSHHICTLEGGITVCQDKNLSDLMRSMRSHGWTRGLELDIPDKENIEILDPDFLFINKGYNLRLSDPQAAVGCIQLSKLDHFINQRSFYKFINNIGDRSILEKTSTPVWQAKSSWFGFPVVFNSIASKEVKRLRKMLLDFKIETRPFFFEISLYNLSTRNLIIYALIFTTPFKDT